MSTFQNSNPRNTSKKKLVSYSVRAQDYLLKQGMKTTDDIGQSNMVGSVDATTNASYFAGEGSVLHRTSKLAPLESLGPLQLPKINASDQSPFKGFIDISLVTQKLRQGVSTGERIKGGHYRSVKNGFLGMSKDGNPFH